MRIVWLVNSCPNFISKEMNSDPIMGQGWIDLLGNRITRNSSDMAFVFRYKEKYQHFQLSSCQVYTFPTKSSEKIENSLETFFERIIEEFNPDIIHIHGTEFFHSFQMFQAAKKKGLERRVVVSIQGLVHIIEKFYLGNLPTRVIMRYTVGDMLRRLNLSAIRRIYAKRGRYEKKLLSEVHNVIGRTDWDKCAVSLINKDVNYYSCNECLREEFYSDSWIFDNCEKHSIFLSQSSNPNKGMHHAIEALHSVKMSFPDAKLYVTGESVFSIPWFKIDSYHKYIKDLINRYELKDDVTFLGNLNSKEMKDAFLRSNVFILPSAMENSPNSLGEAMMLGVPCVASFVGGVPSLFNSNDGFLYDYKDNQMLAFYIKKVFEERECKRMTENAKKHAAITHNIDNNYQSLLYVYDKLNS